MNAIAAALIPLAYLLGTFPSAVLVARRHGVDITAVGSGNPGASNIARTLGARWGVVVFALDALKGAVPGAVGLLVASRPWAYALVAAAVIGHMFPVRRRGKGGKGVATAGGGMIVLHPAVVAVVLVVWYAVRKATDVSSLASISAAVALPIGVAVSGREVWEIVAASLLAVLVVARHRSNIVRLLRRSELSASGRTQPNDVPTIR